MGGEGCDRGRRGSCDGGRMIMVVMGDGGDGRWW